MNCQKIKKLLNPYIDKTLDTDMTKQIGEHLKSCPTCNKEYQSLKEIITSLNSLSTQSAPEDFTRSIMAKISQKEIQIRSSWMDRLKKRIAIPRFSFRLVGAAAAAALIVFFA
ncbi:zf-HC2 domain-containing protein, partial [bacterium]|nr:zf-HC2 domain-containing protein [bacterium]